MILPIVTNRTWLGDITSRFFVVDKAMKQSNRGCWVNVVQVVDLLPFPDQQSAFHIRDVLFYKAIRNPGNHICGQGAKAFGKDNVWE